MIVAIVSSSERACSATASTSSSNVTCAAIGPASTGGAPQVRCQTRGKVAWAWTAAWLSISRGATTISRDLAPGVHTHPDLGVLTLPDDSAAPRFDRLPDPSPTAEAAGRAPRARARSDPETAATPAGGFPAPRTQAPGTTSRRTPSAAGEPR